MNRPWTIAVAPSPAGRQRGAAARRHLSDALGAAFIHPAGCSFTVHAVAPAVAGRRHPGFPPPGVENRAPEAVRTPPEAVPVLPQAVNPPPNAVKPPPKVVPRPRGALRAAPEAGAPLAEAAALRSTACTLPRRPRRAIPLSIH